jgi:hypothetical protein
MARRTLMTWIIADSQRWIKKSKGKTRAVSCPLNSIEWHYANGGH